MSVVPAVRRTAILLVLIVSAAACGSGGQATAAPTVAPTATSGNGSGTGTPRTEVDALAITAKDFSFTLSLTSIHPGLPGVDVFFTNSGAVAHTVTFYTDAGFTTKLGAGAADSGSIAPSASTGFPFIPPDGATAVYYRCEIHPAQMSGSIPVK